MNGGIKKAYLSTKWYMPCQIVLTKINLDKFVIPEQLLLKSAQALIAFPFWKESRHG